MQHCGPVSVASTVLFNISKIYERFYIFLGRFWSFEITKYFKLLCVLPLSEAYSEPIQTSDMELLTESR